VVPLSEPIPDEHREFVERHAETALCRTP
jgi:hypothetical protein